MLGIATASLLLLATVGAARLPLDGGGGAASIWARAVEPKQPPRLPSSYSVNYTFTLPYTAHIQQPAISYPVAFHCDAKAGCARMSTYGDTQIMIAKQGKTMELVPRIDRLVCLEYGDGGGEEAGMDALPDVTGWQWDGVEALNGEDVEMWKYEARVVDYSYFRPGRPNPELFEIPALCKGKQAQAVPGRGHKTGAQLRWAALAPSVRYHGDPQYDVFLAGHGASRSHRSLADYQRRRDLFHTNRRMIKVHNALGRSYTMAMNRFGDFSEDEFTALMLPKRAARQQQLSRCRAAAAAADKEEAEEELEGCGEKEKGQLARYEVPYEPLADATRLPASLTWRSTGADGVGVKDQATCGSCWSFAATGAMEGAWWRATGHRASFSEQQILDCSWGYKPDRLPANLACDGGDHDAAIGYIVEAGGIAENQDYPYKGQDGYCLVNQTHLVGKFKGFARVPRCDDDALRATLFGRGPVAISFDASRPSFRFFSSGVYVDTECQFKPDQLDHSMVLVGYGTSEGGDYWEVKNSWSTHWGEGGYFKVSRDVRHACGVPCDAVYAVVTDEMRE